MTQAAPARPAVEASATLATNGRSSSATATSAEKRLSRRPAGWPEKNESGAASTPASAWSCRRRQAERQARAYEKARASAKTEFAAAMTTRPAR